MAELMCIFTVSAWAIADMPLAEKGLPDTRQGITDNLFAELRQLDYTPATVTMPGDPALEPGDRVALPQADGTAPEMLDMAQ